MKAIDTKGKLFGLINVIDLGVIVILITFAGIFFKLARNAKLGYPIEIEAKVLFPSISLETIEKLQPGDIGIKRSCGSRFIRFELGKKDTADSRDVYAWLRLSVRVKDVPIGNRGEKAASYFLNGAELNIDDPIIFTTSKYSVAGTIMTIGDMDREIDVLLESTFPEEVIDAIKIDDRVIRYGHLVGEVLGKENINGSVKVRLHIKRGEVDLKLGQCFEFATERYSVWGTIVKSNPWREN